MKKNGSTGVIRETFHSWSEDKAPRLAAALTYYTIFSIAPLLVLVIAITGFIIANNAAIRDQVLGQVQTVVGQQGAQMVNTLITNTSRPRDGLIASAIGVLTLIFGATGVFIQLKDALNTIWEVTHEKGSGIGGIIGERLSGLVMIMGLGFLLLVSFVINTALSVLNTYFSNLFGNSGLLPILLSYGIQILVISLIFGAIFKWVPDVELRWRDVWPGALVTTILFLLGQYLISLYLTKASPASTYGAAGSLVVLLLWLYYSAQILFFGAEFTKANYLSRGNEIVPKQDTRLMTAMDRLHQGIPRRGKEDQPRQAPKTNKTGVYPGPMPIPMTGTESERAKNQEKKNDPDQKEENVL